MPSCDTKTGVKFSTWLRNIYQCHNETASRAHPTPGPSTRSSSPGVEVAKVCGWLVSIQRRGSALAAQKGDSFPVLLI